MTDNGERAQATSAAETGAAKTDDRNGPQGIDATDQSAAKTPKALTDIEFNAERLAYYHQIRRDWLDRWRRMLGFAVVFSGTAAFAVAIQTVPPDWAAWLALIPAALGLLDVFFQFTDRAREHELLHRRFVKLLGEIRAADDDNSRYAEWQYAIHAIHVDEPPTYPALDAYAHNAVCEAWGQADHKLKLRWWHYIFKNYWPFWGHDFRKVNA